MGKGSARAFPRFWIALHLLHSVLRVHVDPWSFVECLKEDMAPAILMFGGCEVDWDHHVVGTGLWDRGKMVSDRISKKTFSLRRIVLSPFSNSGCDLFLRLQSRFSAWEECSWRVAAPQRAQSVILSSVSCISGLKGKVFRRKALHGRCSSWMRARSLRNHARAGGIGGVNLVSRNGAAIFGTDTRLASWVGVSAGGSLTQ